MGVAKRVETRVDMVVPGPNHSSNISSRDKDKDRFRRGRRK